MLSLPCRSGLAALALLVAPLAAASISLPLPWQLGTGLRYQVSAVQEDVRAGKSRKTQSTGVQSLKITEAGKGGYLQVWTSERQQTTVSGTADDVESMRRLATALAERLDGMPIEAELDADGSFKRVRNWQVFGNAMREVMLPALLEQNGAKAQAAKIDQAALRTKLQPLLDKLTTEAAISATVGRQASVFNFFTAAHLSQDKPVEYQDYLPSPWSADLIPTRGSFVLEKLSADTATIRWHQDVDPAKGAEVLWKIVEGITGVKPSEAERKALPKGLSLVDEATVLIDRKSGVPLSLDYRREVEAGDLHKSTRLRLDRLP